MITIQTNHRKNIRLKDYDYSQAGYYFITICTKDKQCILWNESETAEEDDRLSNIGVIVQNGITNIPKMYEGISIDKYVVMPNHLHMIVVIERRAMHAPTISRIINQLKGYISKQIGTPIWQKGFYDHIIRNEKEYIEICNYIELNPFNWQEYKYFNQ